MADTYDSDTLKGLVLALHNRVNEAAVEFEGDNVPGLVDGFAEELANLMIYLDLGEPSLV